MIEKKEKKLLVIYISTWSGMLFLLALICGICFRQSFWCICSFTIYQVIAVLLPGVVYVKLLRQDVDRTGTACLFIAYALGYCSNITIYYLLAFLIGQETSQTVYLIVFGVQGIASVVYLIKKKVVFCEKNRNWCILPIVIGVVFLMEMFSYGGYNMLPLRTDGSNVWGDVLYWMGNTVSLKIGYPPVDFRSLRPNYTYHYFSSVQLAVESITTGIPVAELSIYFSFIQPIILIVGGLYCLIEKYIKKKEVLVLFFFLCFFTSGYEEITRVNYVAHIYLSQYGFDYGLGLMLFLLMSMTDFFEKKFSWSGFFFLNILFVFLMGTKSPFACIGIVGIGILCIHFLLRKEWKKSIVQGGIILLLFFFVYLAVCRVEGYSGGNISAVIHGNIRHWEVSENLNTLRETFFQTKYIPKIVLEVFFWLLFVALCHPCVYGLAFFGGALKLFKQKSVDGLDVSCLVMTLVGMSIALYIHMNGKSNTYFALAVYPVAWLFLARSISKILEDRKYIRIMVLLCVFLYGGNLFLNHNAYNPALYYWKVGVENCFGAQEENAATVGGVSYAEYEALQYVKDNIDSDKILISINERRDNKNLTGVFCEHKVVNISVQEAINGENILEKKMKEMEAVYLVVPTEISNLIQMPNRLLYENEEWKVLEKI